MTRTTPIFRLNRVTANPATMNRAIMIQFRAVGLKRSPPRRRTTRIPTDIPPMIPKAASPAIRQNLKRPPRDPSAKNAKVMNVRMMSVAPLALMTLMIVTQAANRTPVTLVRIRRMQRRRLTTECKDQPNRKPCCDSPPPHPTQRQVQPNR